MESLRASNLFLLQNALKNFIQKPLPKTNKIRAPVTTNMAPTHSILFTPATHSAASYLSIHSQAHPLDIAAWESPVYKHLSMLVCRDKKATAFSSILDTGTQTQPNP
jgi:hypothetical protein